jgi:hypothetical protein
VSVDVTVSQSEIVVTEVSAEAVIIEIPTNSTLVTVTATPDPSVEVTVAEPVTVEVTESPETTIVQVSQTPITVEVQTLGAQGASYQEAFETVSKNLKSYPAAYNYAAVKLTSVVYTTPSGTITKTLNYTGDALTSIVLSGSTPSGIALTKTLAYTSGVLTSVSYS